MKAINKDKAIEIYYKLKDLAFAIAKQQDTLPVYCNDPICKKFMAFGSATQLRKGEMVLVDEFENPVFMLTNFLVDEEMNSRAIGLICVKANEFSSAHKNNNELEVLYVDGVKEIYDYVEEIDAYVFRSNNTAGIKIPLISNN